MRRRLADDFAPLYEQSLALDESEERGRWQDHVGDVMVHHLPMTDVLPDEVELREWTEAVNVGVNAVLQPVVVYVGLALTFASAPPLFGESVAATV